MAVSRYRNTNYINEPKTFRYYETTDRIDPQKLANVPTFKIRITRFDRLDNLASIHLGSGEYWWVIALINDLDWLYGFEDGSTFRIPVNVEDVLKLI